MFNKTRPKIKKKEIHKCNVILVETPYLFDIMRAKI